MASPFSDYHSVVRHCESKLLVADLKDILKDFNLSSSGNKRPLIDRVVAQLGLFKSGGDVVRYNALKNKILRAGSPSYPAVPIRLPIRANANGHHQGHQSSPLGMPYNQFAGGVRTPGYTAAPQPSLNFRPSPFYTIEERLSNVATLPFSSRNMVSMSFVCTSNTLSLLNQSSHYKVALMCAESTFAYNPNKQMLMEFPNPVEVLVNSRKLHANLKGMKNKPGTVPPADLTSFLDKTPRLSNRVDITYSCGDSNKKFGAQIVLLKTFSVDELVGRIKGGNRFTKESVLEKLRKTDDDDIEMASFDLTLKDPLSYMRITVPCRSTFCKHNQCWDAMAFLSINEQTPQWTCPICHVAINGLQSIAVDGYFQDILDSVGPEVDTILVDPHGDWKIPGDARESDQTKKEARPSSEAPLEVLDLGDTEDEDDKKSKVIPTATSALQDDTRASTPSVAAAPLPAKRKAPPICIDLTEDSDDEIEPLKRVKHSGSMEAPSGLPLAAPRIFPEMSADRTTPTQAHDNQVSSSVLPPWHQSLPELPSGNGHPIDPSLHNDVSHSDANASTQHSTSAPRPSYDVPGEYSSPMADLSWDALLPLPDQLRTTNAPSTARVEESFGPDALRTSYESQGVASGPAPALPLTTNGHEQTNGEMRTPIVPNRNEDDSPPILTPGSRSHAPAQAFVFGEEVDKDLNEHEAHTDKVNSHDPGLQNQSPPQPFILEDDHDNAHTNAESEDPDDDKDDRLSFNTNCDPGGWSDEELDDVNEFFG